MVSSKPSPSVCSRLPGRLPGCLPKLWSPLVIVGPCLDQASLINGSLARGVPKWARLGPSGPQCTLPSSPVAAACECRPQPYGIGYRTGGLHLPIESQSTSGAYQSMPGALQFELLNKPREDRELWECLCEPTATRFVSQVYQTRRSAGD